MTTLKFSIAAGALALAGGLFAAQPAAALTMQECSAKYNAAKAANSLGGLSWNDFRKAQCGDDAPAAAPAPAPAARSPQQNAPAAAPRTQTALPASNAVFPRAIDRKYATETPAKQRMKTCLDQYNANKAAGANGNGGLNWIQKGGGYYSQCNARMKQIQGV
ncbi:MAG TPA: hypothetical protein PLQ11_06185 [Beijerinckiaceae bacterium]|nr:hypothetical protein [Beijerinckiaceae bacterium]